MSPLARVLEERSDDILRRWRERVRPRDADVPLARVLEGLGASLRGEAGAPPEAAWPGVALSEQVRACHLLRDVVLEVIAERQLPVSREEERRLSDLVARLVTEAVEAHTRAQDVLRHQARVAQETERAQLESLVQHVPLAIAVLRGPALVFEMLNAETQRVWGRPREQLLGKPLLEALPELVSQGFDTLLHEVMATGRPYVGPEVSVPVRQADGSVGTCYFNVTYAPWWSDAAAVSGVLVAAMDVTEWVRAREAVLRERRRVEQARTGVLDALAAQSLVGVAYLQGPEHVFQMANAAHLRMLDRDVMGQGVRNAFADMADQGFFELLDRVNQTGEPFVARETPVRIGPGRTRGPYEHLCDFTYQPVRGPEGEIEGLLTLVVDVTEQVRQRRAAQRLAEEERTRRDFEQYLIGIVSHDLRNPLSSILLGLQLLLRREDLEERTRQSLVRLHASTERAVRMVRDLLDFTQARLGGGLKVERVPGDLHVLVRSVFDELLTTHPERELRLEMSGDGQGSWDGDRIAQLLGNLLANALKYSPPHSRVTVRSVGQDEAMVLEVHNGGAPIAAEALPRLFQPLQRAVEGTDPTSRSVGLGLYIVDQIVRAHGGDIRVESNPKAGTTFRVRLPRAPPPP
ncbi:sensor histidine kinase [Archangium primigenium]|uniref:sensor histidine kinase n=1 Tax=[Archangium] primigenium TaxID=2792470 RepID=UPI0019562741|nr:ATP-binding protein [Archangium primigenium]MBM7116551.1 PAS domain-containing protein [Archangium primigenium]